MNPIIILSIDGGGLRGVVPLTILQEVQKRINPNKELWQSFDLVAGTSTGGLIASALTLKDSSSPAPKAKYSIQQVMDIYKKKGHIIFPQQKGLNKIWHDITGVFRPRFSDKGIEQVFRETLGHNRMSDCLVPLMLSTYDLHTNRPLFFKSIDRQYDASLDPELYDICRATSAGPTYLPAYKFRYAKNPETERAERYCVDGGIYVNNPGMAAVAEMIKNISSYFPEYPKEARGHLEDIYVLSVGTGTYSEKFTWQESRRRGLLWWGTEISELMMRGVNKTTDYEVEQILPRNHYVRLSIDIRSEKFAEMSDSSPETTKYLIDETIKQVLLSNEKMDKLDAFIASCKPGERVSASRPPRSGDVSRHGELSLGSLKDLITKINKPEK